MRASAMKAYRHACYTICNHPQPFRALAYSVCESRPRTNTVLILLLSGPPQLVYMYHSNFVYSSTIILFYFILLPRSRPLFSISTFTSLLRQSYLSLASYSFFSVLLLRLYFTFVSQFIYAFILFTFVILVYIFYFILSKLLVPLR